MSALKPILGAWLLPLPMALILVCVGLVSRRLGRRRLGGALIVAAGLLVFASSFGPVGELLLRPLESRYPPVLDAAALRPTPSYVVVLGSGYRPRAGLPVTAALDSTGVVRLTEGLRLLRQLPDARLVVSGGSVRGWPPIARGYALGATALGVPPASLLMLDTARDTGEEIRALRALVGDAVVLVVTSAAHMPRAMALCRTFGVRAIAAPTGNLSGNRGDAWLPLPSGTALRKSETAWHEYLGLLALQLGLT